jgi:hypothetical protein
MPVVSIKQEFRAPADILDKQRELLGIAKSQVPLVVAAAPILGTWVNCDLNTQGLIHLVLTAKENEITVHGFGACQPNPCDWGVVDGLVFADNVCSAPAVAFTTIYKFAFKETTIVGHLLKGTLMVELFDHFIDGSGRADYYSLEIMSR